MHDGGVSMDQRSLSTARENRVLPIGVGHADPSGREGRSSPTFAEAM
jgi:hypothetical protein